MTAPHSISSGSTRLFLDRSEVRALIIQLRENIARIICCGDQCILEDTANGCILKNPEYDGDLKKADSVLAALSPQPHPAPPFSRWADIIESASLTISPKGSKALDALAAEVRAGGAAQGQNDCGEPVAWRYRWGNDGVWDAVPDEYMLPTNREGWVIEALYASPPAALPATEEGYFPTCGRLLEDINKAAHAAGTNAWVREVLKHAHRAIRRSAPIPSTDREGGK